MPTSSWGCGAGYRGMEHLGTATLLSVFGGFSSVPLFLTINPENP